MKMAKYNVVAAWYIPGSWYPTMNVGAKFIGDPDDTPIGANTMPVKDYELWYRLLRYGIEPWVYNGRVGPRYPTVTFKNHQAAVEYFNDLLYKLQPEILRQSSEGLLGLPGSAIVSYRTTVTNMRESASPTNLTFTVPIPPPGEWIDFT